jgi:hypothetical protein
MKTEIMTPKEKADELVKKMNVVHYMKLGGKNKDSKGLTVSMHDDQIKGCALVCVDEILNATNDIVSENRGYWNEVKTGIENL